MKRFLNWIVISSANPSNVSLTVRGALIANVAVIIAVLQTLGINWSEAETTQWIEGFSATVGAVLLILGFVRKIILTIKDPKKLDN